MSVDAHMAFSRDSLFYQRDGMSNASVIVNDESHDSYLGEAVGSVTYRVPSQGSPSMNEELHQESG